MLSYQRGLHIVSKSLVELRQCWSLWTQLSCHDMATRLSEDPAKYVWSVEQSYPANAIPKIDLSLAFIPNDWWILALPADPYVIGKKEINNGSASGKRTKPTAIHSMRLWAFRCVKLARVATPWSTTTNNLEDIFIYLDLRTAYNWPLFLAIRCFVKCGYSVARGIEIGFSFHL